MEQWSFNGADASLPEPFDVATSFETSVDSDIWFNPYVRSNECFSNPLNVENCNSDFSGVQNNVQAILDGQYERGHVSLPDPGFATTMQQDTNACHDDIGSFLNFDDLDQCSSLQLQPLSVEAYEPPSDPSHSRSRAKFGCGQTQILHTWFDAHSECPYPSEKDLDYLIKATNLEREQVYRWFTNRRARIPEPMTTKNSNTALEAYLADQTEYADETIIREASKSPEYQGCTLQTDSVRSRQPSQPSVALNTALTLAEADSMDLTNSVFSVDDGTVGQARKRGRKRRLWSKTCSAIDLPNYKRRKAVVPSCTVSRSGEITFYCTFCKLALTSKTWKRHEETKHVQREQWICMRDGFRTSDPNRLNGVTCIFCSAPDPDDNHADFCARIADCQARKESDRVFQRKDHLNQHLKNFHQSSYNQAMDHWKDVFAEKSWTCGFCGDVLESWDARAVHVSRHFRDGADINDWSLDRWSCATKPEQNSSPGATAISRDESWEEVYIVNDDTSQNAKTTRVEYEIHVDDGDGEHDPFWDLPAFSAASTPMDASTPPTPTPSQMPAHLDLAGQISSTGYLDVVQQVAQNTEPLVRDPDGPTPPISPSLLPTRSTGRQAPSPPPDIAPNSVPGSNIKAVTLSNPKSSSSFLTRPLAPEVETRIRLLEVQVEHYRTERDYFAGIIANSPMGKSKDRARPRTPTIGSVDRLLGASSSSSKDSSFPALEMKQAMPLC